MRLLYILRVSFIFISSVFFFSCTCPEDKIREDMKMKESAFLSSNSDYHIVKSSVYIYKVGENTNFLANEKIQEIASNYALNKGEANRSRQKANMQRNSTTFDNDFNPNWSEIARNEDNKANISDSIANTYKIKLQNINYSNIPTPIGGIWVFLEIEYKEYLYKCFAGPYVKRFLYLYSNDGEKKTYSSEVYFDNSIFNELLDLTNTKYEIVMN